MKKLKTVYVICNPDKVLMVEKTLKSHHCNYLYSYHSRGGATNDIIDLLGLRSSNRMVIIGVIAANEEARLLKVLGKKLQVEHHGTGIAFTIPLDSLLGTYTYRFLANEIGGQQNG